MMLDAHRIEEIGRGLSILDDIFLEGIVMMKQEDLEGIFFSIGREHGFEDIKVRFSPFDKLKLRWIRCSKTIEMEVSDYLIEAPNDVMEGIADALFEKMAGNDCDYPQCVVDWLSSKTFRDINQQVFIDRDRVLNRFSENDPILMGSYGRLRSEGYIDEIEDLKLFWSHGVMENKGESSHLMRVATVNSYLVGAPEYVLDFCLLSLLANMTIGFEIFGEKRGDSICDFIQRYPRMDDALKWLEEEGIGFE